MLENLTNSDVLILAALIGTIIIIGIICIILTIKSGNKQKKDNGSLDKDAIEPDIHIALATDDIPEINESKDIDHENVINKENEEEQVLEKEEPIIHANDGLLNDFKVKSNSFLEETEEVVEVPRELSKIEEDQDMKNATSIEEVLKAMQVDLEKEKYETIDKYEEEQEENAVISYQELLDRKMALNEDEPLNQTVSEPSYEKSSYLEELPDFREIKLEPIADRDESKPFTNSEFVSPIFGRVSNNVDYPTVKKTVEKEEFIQETITSSEDDDLDKLDETDEFLNTLKEFRNNL